MSYCTVIPTMEPESRRQLHAHYHDTAYGFPIYNDNELFGRLLLEINQAGLSWEIVLKKEAAFRDAYSQYDINAVATYTQEDRDRLKNTAGVIRNTLKINAAIENAKVFLQLQASHGSFENWLNAHHPLSKEAWVKLFKKHFKFTGGEIVNEFLMSIGYLPGAHDPSCPIYQEVLKHQPKWLEEKQKNL